MIHRFDNPFHQPVQVLFHNVWVDIIMDSVDTNSVSVSDWQRKYWLKISNDISHSWQDDICTVLSTPKSISNSVMGEVSGKNYTSWMMCLQKKNPKSNINFSLLATCMVFVELCSNFTPQALGRVTKYRKKSLLNLTLKNLNPIKLFIGPQLRFRIFKRIGKQAVYTCIRFF